METVDPFLVGADEGWVTAGIDPGLNYLYTIAFDDFSEGVLVSTKTSQSNV